MKRKPKFPNQTVERLTALRGILNMHERAQKAGKPCKLNGVKREFDMGTWDCGTAACALGSAALNPWFIERGLHIEDETPVYEDEVGWGTGRKFFGITDKEEEWLFFSWRYPEDPVTPAMVRSRVDELIEKYSKVRP